MQSDKTVAELERACADERRRSLENHWAYSLMHYVDLLRQLIAARRRENEEFRSARGDVLRSGDAEADAGRAEQAAVSL